MNNIKIYQSEDSDNVISVKTDYVEKRNPELSNNRAESANCRPRDHLAAAGKKYPKAWQQAENFRQDRENLGDWPTWCYLPIAGWHAIVGGGETYIPPHQVNDIGVLGALGTWRVTQGIYRFDPTIFEAIVDTPVEGNLPSDVLLRLPEWCVYIETPGMEYQGKELYGFFAHLESDVNTHGIELRLLLDCDDGLVVLPVHLGPWSLVEGMRLTLQFPLKFLFGEEIAPVLSELIPKQTSERMKLDAEPLISLLLYLCSQNAEIGDGTIRPRNPTPRKTKKGYRLFPPNQASTWNVGVRMGSAIRNARRTQSVDDGGSHSSPRSHIRRAHWHGFRSGPIKEVDGSPIRNECRQFTLRWLPPIPVNLESVDDLPATIHPVKGD
jgi:hypothetical protein